jgi:hypothetical protein
MQVKLIKTIRPASIRKLTQINMLMPVRFNLEIDILLIMYQSQVYAFLMPRTGLVVIGG